MGFLNKLFEKGTKTEQSPQAEQGAKVEQVITGGQDSAKVEQVRYTKEPEDSLRCRTEQELIERFGGIALQWYLDEKGYKISEQGEQLAATKGGDTITTEFDELSRLTNLKG